MPASASGQRRKSRSISIGSPLMPQMAAAAVAGRFVGALGSGRDRKDHPAAAFDVAKSRWQRAHLGGPIGLRLRALMAAEQRDREVVDKLLTTRRETRNGPEERFIVLQRNRSHQIDEALGLASDDEQRARVPLQNQA